MSAMGVKIDQFDIPVCNSFQAMILNDQLCYEVDLNNFSDNNNIQNELKVGFNFIMDYNEDRQVHFDQIYSVTNMEYSLSGNILGQDTKQDSSIYFNRVLLGTVRCAAVGNKVAAFYYFMFAEAKKQHFLIKFTPAWSWSI